MTIEEFWKFWALLNEGTETGMNRQQVLDYLDIGRRLNAPLGVLASKQLSAILSLSARPGYEIVIEPYEGRYRVITKKIGRHLADDWS